MRLAGVMRRAHLTKGPRLAAASLAALILLLVVAPHRQAHVAAPSVARFAETAAPVARRTP